METNKIISLRYQLVIGYILLATGLLLIGWTLYQSYNIFTAKASVPLIFRTQNIKNEAKNINPLDSQKQMEEIIRKQLSELIPADTLPKILNLVSWSIFAGILIFGGAQITGLGIKMLR